MFDDSAYLKGVADLPHQPPVLLEHLATAAAYRRARKHALKVAKGLSITIET